jgi:Pyridoxamine 5'-phosphate oxidase
MSKPHDCIDPPLAEWISQQHVFFVATAPINPDGLLNLSPKGGDAFRILGPLEVAYQDYTGSGAETAAHLRENGRIVMMWCAFCGPPKIVRLHGRGTVVTPDQPRFLELAKLFPTNPGARAIVHVAVSRVSASCGYAVPFFEFRQQRDALDRWATTQGPEGLEEYRARKNRHSIEGLPAFDPSGQPSPDG